MEIGSYLGAKSKSIHIRFLLLMIGYNVIVTTEYPFPIGVLCHISYGLQVS